MLGETSYIVRGGVAWRICYHYFSKCKKEGVWEKLRGANSGLPWKLELVGVGKSCLTAFENRSIRVLVAADVAAGGLGIDALPHVVNYELPDCKRGLRAPNRSDRPWW